MCLPDAQNAHARRVTGRDNKEVLRKELPFRAHGTVAADLSLDSDAALGYYNVKLLREQNIGGAGSFYVEEYKKPEYQVTVKPPAPRVLQGNSIQATIEARYFFGEPVAGAKVTYVVHTSTHYWWDEDDEDDNGDSAMTPTDASDDSDDSDDTYGQTEQQEHQGVLDANGQLTVTLPTRGRRQAQRPGLSHRGARDGCGQSRGERPLHGAGHLRFVPRERGADELCCPSRAAGARQGDGAGLRRQAGADAGAHRRGAGEVGFRDAPADETPVASSKMPPPARTERRWSICR